MKKILSAVAITALCATVASADVTSGIVGYQDITVGTGYHLFTVTFKDVSGSDFDLQKIKVFANGSEMETRNGVKLQKVDSAGAYTTVYGYRKDKGGWVQGTTLVPEGTVTFANGEAVCLNNVTAGNVQMRVSGAVELNPWSGEIPAKAYYLVGNMTPVTIDLQDMVPYVGEEELSVRNGLKLQKMDATGNYLDVYGYRKDKGGWVQGTTLVPVGTVTFSAGESACAYNNTDSVIQLKYKSPIVSE